MNITEMVKQMRELKDQLTKQGFPPDEVSALVSSFMGQRIHADIMERRLDKDTRNPWDAP